MSEFQYLTDEMLERRAASVEELADGAESIEECSRLMARAERMRTELAARSNRVGTYTLDSLEG
jgi:hypothetical protein